MGGWCGSGRVACAREGLGGEVRAWIWRWVFFGTRSRDRVGRDRARACEFFDTGTCDWHSCSVMCFLVYYMCVRVAGPMLDGALVYTTTIGLQEAPLLFDCMSNLCTGLLHRDLGHQ